MGCAIKTPNTPINSNAHKTLRLMNIQNAIQQLETAQTGDEILMILEALEEPNAAPTLDPIEF